MLTFSGLYPTPSHAQGNIHKIRAELTTAKDHTDRIDLLNSMGKAYRQINQDSAAYFSDLAFDLASQTQYIEGMALARENQAFLAFQRGDISKCGILSQEFLSYARELNEPSYISAAENALGNVAIVQEDYRQALERFLTVMKIESERKDQRRMAITSMNIGSVFSEMGRDSKALDYFREAYRLARAVKDSLTIAQAYNNLATIHENAKTLDSARSYYRKAYGMVGELSTYYKAVFANNLGGVMVKQGDFDKGEKALFVALRTSQTNNLPYVEGLAYANLAQSYLVQEEYETALKYGQKSLDIGNQYKLVDLRDMAIATLEKAFDRAGQIDSAYLFKQMRLEFEAEDRIKKNETRLKQLSFSHDLALREREIAYHTELVQQKRFQRTVITIVLTITIGLLLTLGILGLELKRKRKFMKETAGQLKDQHQKLVDLNRSKDRIFSIIAHDIRTPLNNVSGLIEIILGTHISMEESQFLGKKINKQIQEAVGIFDNLLRWSRSHLMASQYILVKTDMRELIIKVVSNHQVKAQQKNIDLTYDLQEEVMVMTEPGMIETVIRNLLTNAIKFSPTSGRIHVKLQTRGNHAFISVKDTGAGMNNSKLKTLFNLNTNQTTPGTQNERGTGLGLPLTREFVEQHKGQIWAESEPGKGSTFLFTLPIIGR